MRKLCFYLMASSVVLTVLGYADEEGKYVIDVNECRCCPKRPVTRPLKGCNFPYKCKDPKLEGTCTEFLLGSGTPVKRTWCDGECERIPFFPKKPEAPVKTIEPTVSK
ncbi:MAG: hypothetical protein HQK53_06695 [Oligoflexia bacterium]|nr:hypothetical protein [Oligoflexia bacterium]